MKGICLVKATRWGEVERNSLQAWLNAEVGIK